MDRRGGGAKSPCCVSNCNTTTKRDNEQVTEFSEALDLFLKGQAGYSNPDNGCDARKARRIVQDTAAGSDITVRDDTAQSDSMLIFEEDVEDMVSEYDFGLIRI